MSNSEASVGQLTATGWLTNSCRWWVLVVAVIFSSSPLLASQDNDLLDLDSGALVLSATTQYGGRWNAQSLLDGAEVTGWSSTKGYPYPNTLVIELPRQYLLTSFVIDNTGADESGFPGISARHFVLYASTDSQDEGFELVLSSEAAKGERKVFELEEPTEARWLKFAILSNWGNAAHTQVMELEAYGEPVGTVPRQMPLHGIYSTKFGLMRLEQRGSLVIGCYDGDNGTLAGRTNGRLLKFRWWENGPNAGTAAMVLSADGSSLNGLWYQRGQMKGMWYASRVTDGRQPKCQVPALDALMTAIYEPDVKTPSEKTEAEKVLEETLQEQLSGEKTVLAILSKVYFDSDSAELKPEAAEGLTESLTELLKSPSQKIILKGHTDSTNTEAYNLELSLRRAQTVMEWLIGNGVDASRMAAKGYGEFRPVADNSTEEGRALNRRVEISMQ